MIRTAFSRGMSESPPRRLQISQRVVRLSPSNERFLALRHESRDECRDAAQRASDHLAASHVASMCCEARFCLA
jgi:hypothetical protein